MEMTPIHATRAKITNRTLDLFWELASKTTDEIRERILTDDDLAGRVWAMARIAESFVKAADGALRERVKERGELVLPGRNTKVVLTVSQGSRKIADMPAAVSLFRERFASDPRAQAIAIVVEEKIALSSIAAALSNKAAAESFIAELARRGIVQNNSQTEKLVEVSA